MIAAVRSQEKRTGRRALQSIIWHRAGLVWSMDDMEFEPSADGGQLHVHAVEELGSRYKLPPLVGKRLADGPTVAAHLSELFIRFGPPLFLKRDNHGNLNSGEVDAVMDRFLVLPLNSPPYYAPYNGAIERAQRELQEAVCGRLAASAPGTPVASVVEAVIQDLNHQPRPCLEGKTACAMFSLGLQEARSFTRSQRKEVCDWIKSLAARIMAQGNGAKPMSAAQCWRIAAQTWLQRNGVISIARQKKCYLVS
jgi:hypothetical protein